MGNLVAQVNWGVAPQSPCPGRGLPATYAHANGGMMDLTLDPDYTKNGWIYIAHAHSIDDPTVRESRAVTRVIRGRIRDHRWVDQEVVFQGRDELHHSSPVRWGARFIAVRGSSLRR
jgi:glucose/arabinose dehydrogenase